MTTSCLRSTVFCLGLAWGAGTTLIAASPVAVKMTRPQIQSLSIQLQDGRSYSLSNPELQDQKGGAIFWGDWAVINILLPHCVRHQDEGISPDSVFRLWFTPWSAGELPAFMVLTSDGLIYPLASTPSDVLPDWSSWVARPKVASIQVGYVDGRVITLSQLTIQDQKSGIMVWSDYAVAHLFMPFYTTTKNLVTKPESVMRFWSTPLPASPGVNTFGAPEEELPGFMVKPKCIPSYPGPEE